MAVQPCPNACPECPWFDRPVPPQLQGTQEHGCFSDLDHIVPQRYARAIGATALERTYILDYPGNKQQLCRWEHDDKCAEGDEPIPAPEVMRERLAQALLEGIMVLSRTKRKQIFGKKSKNEICNTRIPTAA